MMVYSTATNFKKAYYKHGKPIPEERLPPMIICAIILPIALFWFAWSSMTYVSWVPSVIATAFLGMSLLVTFWQGINYIIVSTLNQAQTTALTIVGRLRLLQQQRYRSQYVHPVNRRRRISTFCIANVSEVRFGPHVQHTDASSQVPWTGRTLGHISTSIHHRHLHSCSHTFLQIWGKNSGAFEVCSDRLMFEASIADCLRRTIDV